MRRESAAAHLFTTGGSTVSIAKGRTSIAGSTATLSVGDPAPPIVLPAHNAEQPWSLADAKGVCNIVLAFFPFAFTPV